MRAQILTLTIITALSSCKHEVRSDAHEVILNERVPFKYEKLFKIAEIDTFYFDPSLIDSLDLNRIDSIQFLELFQTDTLNDYNNPKYIHYFYSFQSSKSSVQSVTLILNTEYNHSVLYVTYSKDGKLISKFDVAGSSGDGLFSNDRYGHFVNDSTYLFTSVDNEFLKDSDQKPFRSDTTTKKIYLNEEGKFVIMKN